MNSRKLRNGRCALSPAPPRPPQLVSWKGPASSQVRLASHHGFPRPRLLCCLLWIPHTHPPTWQPVSTLGPRQCPELKHRVRYILARLAGPGVCGSDLRFPFFVMLLVLNIGHLKVSILWKIADVLGFY